MAQSNSRVIRVEAARPWLWEEEHSKNCTSLGLRDSKTVGHRRDLPAPDGLLTGTCSMSVGGKIMGNDLEKAIVSYLDKHRHWLSRL